MAKNYTKTIEDGKAVYRLGNKVIKPTEMPEEVKAALSASKPGTQVDMDGNTVEQGDGSENDKGKTSESASDSESTPPVDPQEEVGKAEEAKAAKAAEKSSDEGDVDKSTSEDEGNNPVDSGLQQDEAGMGFPRRKGYTVDIFDLKTPHTHVRNIQGIMVPLSEENFKTKSEAAIMARVNELRKEGKVIV